MRTEGEEKDERKMFSNMYVIMGDVLCKGSNLGRG